MGKVEEEVGGRPARPAAPVPFKASHDVSKFECGEASFDDWLKHRALKNESRFSRTYVVCVENRVIAYFCISAGSVERSRVPGKIRRNAPGSVPVSIIGRLAVDLAHAGRGLGSDLLSDTLRRIATASQNIGMAAVMVHAKDDKAKAFYLACGEFIEFPAESRTLFLPIDTVIAAFG